MDVVEDFLLQVQNASRLDAKKQPQRLLDLLKLHPQTNPFIARLNNIGHLNEKQLATAIERRNLYSGEWMAFESVLHSFISLCNQLNPWSILESFDLYSNYINNLTVAFSNRSKGYLLTALIEDVIDFVLPFAKQLDNQMLLKEMHRRPRLTYMASILLKIFNNIRSQLGADDHIEAEKKKIFLFVGNKLCQTYFHLSNPVLCRNVFSNMSNAKLNFKQYSPNQQIQYRYYLAKFYMVKYQFVDAYQHFFWCLQMTPHNCIKDNDNVTRILRDFLPISIILGKTPSMDGFAKTFYSSPASYPPFLSLYTDLLRAIKRGNFFELHILMNNAESAKFLQRYHLGVFLSSKAMTITLRNLFKSVWIVQGKLPTLEFEALKHALALSLNGLDLTSVTEVGSISTKEQKLDDSVIQNCLVTLIDQNLLRGKLVAGLRVASLAKTDAFAPANVINFLKFGNGAEGTMSHADKWIEH